MLTMTSWMELLLLIEEGDSLTKLRKKTSHHTDTVTLYARELAEKELITIDPRGREKLIHVTLKGATTQLMLNIIKEAVQ